MADAVEQALINFVVQGSLQASQKADRVETDLRSAEAAGRAAEAAAEDAASAAEESQQAAQQLDQRVQAIVGRLSQAAGLISFGARAAEGFGADPSVTGAFAAVAGETAGGAAQGALLGSFVPGVGTAVGAAIGGGIGFASSVVREVRKVNEIEEKEKADIAKKVAEELRRNTLEQQAEQQAALAMFGSRFGGVQGPGR